MRVLFINFNLGSTPGINNGLAVLSALLKKRGHIVGLIFLCEDLNYGFNLARLKKDIVTFDPDIIGISLMEPQFKYMVTFCNDLRKYYRGFVICGGPYPTMDPETVISVEGINAVCVGEGEDALIEVVEALQAGRPCSNIQNIWFKLQNGSVVKNRLRPFKNLNELPPEDKELFDLDKILPIKNYQLEMTLGRGCIYECSYCINKSYLAQYRKLCDERISPKGYLRTKNIDTVIQEIKNVVSKHPQIKKIAFIDDNFLIYNEFIERFFKKYKKEIGMKFMCNANPLSYNSFKGKLLEEAGCDDIRFGVESGSERIRRDIMKRHITNRSIINAFKINQELEIMTSSFNMIGLPTETKDEVFETLKLNALITPDSVKVMTFYPFSNTPLYDLCVKLDLIDYDKKNELDNYDTSTCLKFSNNHQLFLQKIQNVFNWYINIFLNNEASLEYRKLIQDIERMPEAEWRKFDFYEIDKEVSQRLRKKGLTHYSKFVNRSLAVRFPSKHFN